MHQDEPVNGRGQYEHRFVDRPRFPKKVVVFYCHFVVFCIIFMV